MPRSFIQLCALFFAVVAASAQEPHPELMRLSVAGPAAMRSRLLPTDLGSLCSSADAVAIWAGYVERLDAALRAAHGDDDAFARERARFLGYAGTFHVVVWLEQAEDGIHVPRWSLLLIAEPDARTDLQAMASECERWLARIGDTMDGAARELGVATPRIHDGRLLAVLAAAEDLEAANARAERFVPASLPRDEVVHLEIDVPPSLLLMRDRNWERGIASDLLGSGLQRATFAVGSRGPNVSMAMTVTFGEGSRGLLGGLLPPRTSIPDLEWLVPKETSSRFSWQLDAGEMWSAWSAVLAGAFERDVKEIRADEQKRLGIDVQRDVFAHLHGDALLLWRAAELAAGDGDDPFGDACLVLPVRDGRALEAGAAKLLRAIGSAPDVDGDDVFYGQWAGLGHVAIGYGVACIAFGERGRDHVDAVLELAAERQSRGEVAAVKGNSLCGSGRIDVSALLARDFYAMVRGAMVAVGAGDFAPSSPVVTTEAQRWLPLLKASGLEDAAVELKSGASEVSLRVLW